MSSSKNKALDSMLKMYLENLTSNNTVPIHQQEMEIRFGSNHNPLQKSHHDNILRYLYAYGFTPENENIHGTSYLRINNMSDNKGTSKTRLELIGKEIIQDFCRNNNILSCLGNPQHSVMEPLAQFHAHVKLTEKAVMNDMQSNPIQDITNDDFDFRISYKSEKTVSVYNAQSTPLKTYLEKTQGFKNHYRFIKRVRFVHAEFPYAVDVSTIKSGNGDSITESGLMRKEPRYEVEIELLNNLAKSTTPVELAQSVRKGIRLILSGWQNSMFPIPWKQQQQIRAEYEVLINGDNRNSRHDNNSTRRPVFFGPKPITLQDYHLSQIQENYTVTDKADGERHLLFVSQQGQVCLLNQNLEVVYTGYSVEHPSQLKNLLIDGEYIPPSNSANASESDGRFAAFDIYFMPGNGKIPSVAVHQKPLTHSHQGTDKSDDIQAYRLSLLEYWMNRLHENLKPQSSQCLMKFSCKTFYGTQPMTVSCMNYVVKTEGLHVAAKELLQFDREKSLPYALDGLIYTPAHTGIQGTIYKWKPPEKNTIDFFVTIVQEAKKDKIQTVPLSGRKYKTLILRCGYNTDIVPVPYENMLREELPVREVQDSDLMVYTQNARYKPVRFVPTAPYLENVEVFVCYVEVGGDGHIYAQDPREIIENHTIVEFKYDVEKKLSDADHPWRWEPLRIRHDKTAQLRAHKNMFGNDYRVAQNNWYSIHHPVNETIITNFPTPAGAAEVTSTSEVYYKNDNDRGGGEHTRRLRTFHNHLKRHLISMVADKWKRFDADKGQIQLMDLSVGKAGDLDKWTEAGIAFVFGVDYARDNIVNNMDGACARYIQLRIQKGRNYRFRALFLHGDSALNIRDGSAFREDSVAKDAAQVVLFDPSHSTDKELFYKNAMQAMTKQQYKGVLEIAKRSWGSQGFHITSCQFSVHYFFGNAESLHGFLCNVAENTRPGGYFIGTCYDGRTVFDKFRQKDEICFGQVENNHLYFRLKKKYSHEGFDANNTCLGYKIGVYQEHINQTIDEYLVHYEYFREMLGLYGLTEIQTGMFKDFYDNHGSKGAPMTAEEKEISFLNRYFVFQKDDRDINARQIANNQIAVASQNRVRGTSPKAASAAAESLPQAPEETTVIKNKEKKIVPRKLKPAPKI